jgi:hypothetical protein
LRTTLAKMLKLLPIILLPKMFSTKLVSFKSNSNKVQLCKTGKTVLKI